MSEHCSSMKPWNIFIIHHGVSPFNPDHHPEGQALLLSPLYRWTHRVREDGRFIQDWTASKRQHQGADFSLCRASSMSCYPKRGDAGMLWTSGSHWTFVTKGEAWWKDNDKYSCCTQLNRQTFPWSCLQTLRFPLWAVYFSYKLLYASHPNQMCEWMKVAKNVSAHKVLFWFWPSYASHQQGVSGPSHPPPSPPTPHPPTLATTARMWLVWLCPAVGLSSESASTLASLPFF